MPIGSLVLLVAAVVSGCTISNLELTRLQQSPPFWVDVHALSSWRHVDRTARNAVRLQPGATVGIRVEERTDGTASAEFVVPTADGLLLHLGTTPYDLRTKADSGHVLRIGASTSTLTMANGTTYRIQAGVPAAVPTIVSVVNDGRTMRVQVGCAEPLELTTQRPTTEWIIVHAPAGCDINDPELNVMYPTLLNGEQQSIK